MALTKRIRYEVLRRDDFACRYCGARAPEAALTVDHVMPIALGGSDDPTNLVTACRDCNAGKSSTSPDDPIVADVAADALRWAQAIEVAAGQLEQSIRDDKTFVGEWLETWEKWSEIDYLPVDFDESLKRFRAGGLSLEVLKDNAFRATGARHVTYRNQFRYFCGICHNQIREIRDAATAYVSQEVAENGS